MKRLVSVLLILLALILLRVNRLEPLFDRWIEPAVLVTSLLLISLVMGIGIEITVRGMRRLRPTSHPKGIPADRSVA